MRTVKVKICGITRDEDLFMTSALGADAVGFVVGVPSSPRNVTLKEAERMIRLVPIFTKSVLVTIPTSVDELLTYEKLGADVIQIHGEDFLDVSTLREKVPDTRLIRAIHAKPVKALKVALEASKSFDAILLDSFANGRYGGTGVVHDWDLSKRVLQAIHPKPLILAGGLDSGNVKDAIRTVQPYAVDVCSGVEEHLGIKDPEKLLAFIRNAKEVAIPSDAEFGRSVDAPTTKSGIHRSLQGGLG